MIFSLDEKEIFLDGEFKDNWLKNDFNEEYTLDISDVKFVSEKGFFHLFGELFVTEINFVRNEAPDKTECVLSMGKVAGKSTCPEHESFHSLSWTIGFYSIEKFNITCIFMLRVVHTQPI